MPVPERTFLSGPETPIGARAPGFRSPPGGASDLCAVAEPRDGPAGRELAPGVPAGHFRRLPIAGKYGAAGRLITGLEYRLAARFDGRPGVSPDLLPASGKAGPGRSVNIPWRECLRLMGEEWDQADRKDDDAARKRFDRMYARLESVGYKVPGPRGEAPAGDTVEIVGRRKGGNNHGGELIVRASARFVAAAKLAKKPDGKGFEPVSLIHWLGRK